MFYNWHRSYDPQTGRYTQPDPIGLEGGWNRFTYVENNPLWAIDPTGEVALVDDLAIAGAAAALTCAVAKPCREAIGNAMVTTAKAINHMADQIILMAKGGSQNKENEWSRAARLQPDPCQWLRQQYLIATDSVTRQKIKTAKKVLGCRRNSSLNEDCQ